MAQQIQIPFRLGTTSYIIPDEILPNVAYLGPQVSDIELVLFEVDDGPNNLPTPEQIERLGELAEVHQLSYTVHLPLDLRLGADGDEQHVSLVKARRVIECTRALQPWAYVAHLDGREVRAGAQPEAMRRWQDQTIRALEITAGWAGGESLLAVENLEGYPLDFWEPIFERCTVSRCVDIGHLWLDGHDPLPYLRAALPRTIVIHLHGIAARDHSSLAHVPVERLQPVLDLLRGWPFTGVVTVEVFSEADFQGSMTALETCCG
jgi:sugar phosphate isomerase/epimerase